MKVPVPLIREPPPPVPLVKVRVVTELVTPYFTATAFTVVVSLSVRASV